MMIDWNLSTEIFGNVFLDALWQGLFLAVILKVVLIMIPERRADLRYLAAIVAMIALAVWVGIGAVASLSEVVKNSNAEIAWEPTPDLLVAGQPAAIPQNSRSSALPPSLNSWLFTLWIIGCSLSLFRIARGLFTNFHLVEKSAALPSKKLHRANTIQRELFGKLRLQIRASGSLVSPVMLGWLRPVILFPTSMLTGMPSSHFDAILLHELAHFRRCDYFFHLIQSLLEAALFFHPAVWWISAQINRERERACDDRAAAWLGSQHSYASALGWLEKNRAASPAGTLSLQADGTSVVDRIRRLTRLQDLAPVNAYRSRCWTFLTLVAFATTISALATTKDSEVRGHPGISDTSRFDIDIPIELVESATNFVEQPVNWNNIKVGQKNIPLLRSVILIERDGIVYDPYDPESTICNPLPNHWIIDHDLDILDSSLPNRDNDDDGFSNLEEYNFKTDPTDPNSRPPYIQKLEYAAHNSSIYPVTFAALPSGDTCQLNRSESPNYGPRDSFLLREGDLSKDGNLRVISISPEKVVVEFVPLRKEVTLLKKSLVEIPIRFAQLKLSVGNSEEITVREGDTFRLTADSEMNYRLKSANESECVITGEDRTEYLKKLSK